MNLMLENPDLQTDQPGLKKAEVSPSNPKRYIPLMVWVVAIMTVLLIPAKIISYGYLPADDALRHAAKAVCGKPWSEILVMRSDFPIDIHDGWHKVLGAIHRAFNADAEALVIVSVAGLMILVSASVLIQLRRPEAWLAALLAGAVFVPELLFRLSLGRPYLFTIAVFITLLFIWSAAEDDLPSPIAMLGSVLLIAAAAWIHGTWYLLGFPAAGLFLTGRWRPMTGFLACWLTGSFLGACLTGHPFQSLGQSLRLVTQVFGHHLLTRQLFSEFLPSNGNYAAVLMVAAVLLWRSRSPDWKARELLHPIFLVAIVGWVLGLKVNRFWLDWGLPAMLVWVAITLQKQFRLYLHSESWTRLWVTFGLAAATFFQATADVNSRWTLNMTAEYLTADNPNLAGWLPEPGGIIYSADANIFYQTFFKNPNAPWHYVLGFEPALMLPEDLEVMHKIDWNFGDLRAYEPWVRKMRPQDRLILRASTSQLSGKPNIPELEWYYGVTDYWIGRLPRQAGKTP